MSRSARESLVSDIPAGDGKTANFFHSVTGDRRRAFEGPFSKSSRPEASHF
jgi:hypothetical protein